VLCPAPVAGCGAWRRRRLKASEQASERVPGPAGSPRRDSKPPAGAADARQLTRGRGVIGREHDSVSGCHDVEARIGVGELLGIADVEADRQVLLGRPAPRRLDLRRCEILPRYLGTGARRSQGNGTGARADVEPALSRSRFESRDQTVVDVGHRLGDALPWCGAPHRRRVRLDAVRPADPNRLGQPAGVREANASERRGRSWNSPLGGTGPTVGSRGTGSAGWSRG
jgi:hypothetical protein